MTISPGSLPSKIKLPSVAILKAEQARRTANRCKTLAGFVREAWHVLEPHTTYVDGWHIEAICEHLEAVSRGEIIRLLINVPPGFMKSLLVSVMWPAWEWTTRPSLSYIATSYKDELSTRDTRKMRDLVMSEWYQSLWPHVRLSRNGETSFANDQRGWRESMSFTSLTGGRADRVIIDDPHSTEKAESEPERLKAERIFRESVGSRVNDPNKSAIIIVMQRLHERDVSGVILRLGLPYVHVCLPMEMEIERRCATKVGFIDPRTYDGELLFPQRFSREWLTTERKQLTEYAYAGQYQQRPAPREGGMFKRAWFGIVNAAPVGTKWVRHWDLAASTRKTSPYTAGLKLGRGPDGVFYIGDVQRDRLEGAMVRALILQTAMLDGRECEISLPQDPGQAGKVQVLDYISMLAGFVAHAEPESGDKQIRAEPSAAQAEAGNMKLVRGDWNEAFLDEVSTFPAGAYKDQVDALSGAFGRLTARKGWAFAGV